MTTTAANVPYRTDEPDLWLRRFGARSSGGPTLICLPHAGGAATFFRPLVGLLAAEVDVTCVQYPGRQDRRGEPPVDTIDALADLLTEVIRPTVRGPVALFGHSMGAILGFEVALRLEQLGVAPLRLFASGRRAPGVSRHETVHLRDDRGLLADVAELSGTEDDVFADEELTAMVLPAIRADYRAIETYAPRPGVPRLRCPVTALHGTSDPRVDLADAHAWAGHTDGGFRLQPFPGDHFFLLRQWTPVARAIRTDLRLG
ncbi:thioesterase II family protein [Micromonospora sp. WMMD723]|uniref:thioesterase II family protein n=1 Tax=unclassified Micromonospora TaxID=2617518 RepID=UPI003B929CFF